MEDFFFREDWLDYANPWPACPWEFTIAGGATLELMDTDELIPPDWYLERNLRLTADTAGSIELSRLIPPPDCEYVMETSFTLNVRAGGVFTIGLGSNDQAQQAVAVLDAREGQPVAYARDVDGELVECGTFTVGEWTRVIITVEEDQYKMLVRAETDASHIDYDCSQVVWRDSADIHPAGIVMATGPDDGAQVDVNFLVFDRLWPDEP